MNEDSAVLWEIPTTLFGRACVVHQMQRSNHDTDGYIYEFDDGVTITISDVLGSACDCVDDVDEL
jgi:hypothetical protein